MVCVLDSVSLERSLKIQWNLCSNGCMVFDEVRVDITDELTVFEDGLEILESIYE